MNEHDRLRQQRERLIQERDRLMVEQSRLYNVLIGLNLAIEIVAKEDERTPESEWVTDEHGNLSRAVGHRRRRKNERTKTM